MGKYSYCTQCTFMKILNVYKTDIFTEFKKKKEPAAAHFLYPLCTVHITDTPMNTHAFNSKTEIGKKYKCMECM